MKPTTLLQALAAVSIVSFIIGIINVVKGNFSGIAYPFIPLGIFIWGDTLVISPLLGIASFWLIKKNNPIWTGLFFSLYVCFRSFIEVLYSLNAQFSSITRPWEAYWNTNYWILKLGLTEAYVLSQLIFMSITLISFLVFIYNLKKYFSLNYKLI